MKISTLKFSQNIYEQNKLNSSHSKGKNASPQPSFAAWKYPSGEYSDWFVKLMKKFNSYTRETCNKKIEEHLNEFAIETKARRADYVLFFVPKKVVNADVALRRTDCNLLLDDIKHYRVGRKIGHKNYDEPSGRYSSPNDYTRRKDSIDPPKSEPEYLDDKDYNPMRDYGGGQPC